MSKRKTTCEFIIDCKVRHLDKYDYSLVEYINNKTKIKIICPIHGVFEQTPNNHLNVGNGCPFCSNNKKMTTLDFIKKSKEIHGDKYDYSNTKYTNSLTKVEIICNIHGSFFMTPNNHISKKYNCPKCKKNIQLTTEKFIEKSKKTHNNKYDYSLVEYKNVKSKVKIICPKHGMFEQKSYNHLNGVGCPFCKTSKGEKKIEKYLNDKNIKYIRQYKFKKCINKRMLPFDFYLPEYNMCIEYNGRQHYETIEYFGGKSKLKYIKNNDKIKEVFCKENNIELLKIKFNEKIIEKLNEIK
jgi:very-short-patch-repair endonuclease